MSKNKIQNIIIHNADDVNLHALSDRINEFHVDLIEQRLHNSNLTLQQKITVIDKIIENQKTV